MNEVKRLIGLYWDINDVWEDEWAILMLGM